MQLRERKARKPIYVDLPEGDVSEIENESEDDIEDPDFRIYDNKKADSDESEDDSNIESSESASDEDDQPKTSAKATKSKKKKPPPLKWDRDTLSPKKTEWKSKLPNPPQIDEIEPFEIFRKFMPRSIFNWIKDETNKYSEDEQEKSIDATTDEIEQFIGILFFMSVVAMPH